MRPGPTELVRPLKASGKGPPTLPSAFGFSDFGSWGLDQCAKKQTTCSGDGYGSKLNHQGTAGFSPRLRLPAYVSRSADPKVPTALGQRADSIC